MITVIGMGPGDPEYVTPIAWSKAKNADILVGSDRLLRLFTSSSAKKVSISSNMRSVVEGLTDIKEKKVAVLVSGDPGLFSLLKMIKEHVDGEFIEVIPGISSAQMLFSKTLSSWDDVVFVTLHGREGKTERLLEAARKTKRMAVFNGPEFTADRIAKTLITGGYKGVAIVGQQLSLSDESVKELSLEELGKTSDIRAAVILFELKSGKQADG